MKNLFHREPGLAEARKPSSTQLSSAVHGSAHFGDLLEEALGQNRTEWENTPAPTSKVEAAGPEDHYVIVTEGDSAQCFIVPETRLRSSIHSVLCSDNHPYKECETGPVLGILQTLEDDDYWTNPARRSAWEHELEDGSIQVYRLTSQAGLATAPISGTADYWYRAAKNESYTMAERLLAMENAYNHVNNALAAAQKENLK